VAGLTLRQFKAFDTFESLLADLRHDLESPLGKYRQMAAEALARLGDTQSAPALRERLKDPEELVAEAARHALSILDGDGGGAEQDQSGHR
jgi:HEAT repeat protein